MCIGSGCFLEERSTVLNYWMRLGGGRVRLDEVTFAQRRGNCDGRTVPRLVVPKISVTILVQVL
jgi:hypothetical protein